MKLARVIVQVIALLMVGSICTTAMANIDQAKATRPIPPLIPAATFVDPGYIRKPVISPDGTKLVFRERIGKKTLIGIKPVDSDTITHVGLPEGYQLDWYRWAGDKRLLISISRPSLFLGFEIRFSSLVTYDLATSTSEKLGNEGTGFDSSDIIYADPDGEYLLVSMQPKMNETPAVFRLNLADKSLTEVVKSQSNIWSWLADSQGIVRMGFAFSPYSTKIYYRRSNDQEFQLISKIKQSDSDEKKEESLIDVTRIVSGRDDGYVLSNKETGRFALYKFNYLTREIGELVYAHPENDITSFSLNDEGTALESIRYTDSRDRTMWFNSLYRKRQEALDAALPGQEAWMQSRSRDGSKMLVYITSPTDPGSYALFEPKAAKLDRFAAVNDLLDSSLLAETKYVRYPARDGLQIPSYLTLPVGRKPKDLPLIILPHGGPYGVRDTLDYNMEVQFLANRGYAVLQPNFRGSDSYGEDYYKKGEGQIGRAMQDDLDDGMDWLVKDGIVDPARVWRHPQSRTLSLCSQLCRGY
jgi:dipeptidyl aminopeptidase/acylaminoacyl peptidase